MMDFSLKNHDIEITNGDLMLCRTDKDAIAQAITMRLKTHAEECFLDTSVGIPYLTEVFGQKRSQRFIQQLIVPAIESVAGVREVKDFRVSEGKTRKLEVTFSITLADQSHLTFQESIGI